MTETTIRLHVGEWSAGGGRAPIVLLHGLANRWQAMAPLVTDLARRWHVLAPDLRGHGRSPRAERYSVRLCAADVADLIAERRLEPVVVYGHSLGGLVGLTLAAEHPGLVRAVIVGDAAVLVHPRGRGFEGVPPVAAHLADASGRVPKGVDPDVLESFRRGHLLADYDGPALLRRVSCPVLLLRGSVHRGAHLSETDARRAVALLADGRQVAVPDAGHQLQITHRGAVLAAMRPFLAHVQPSPIERTRVA